MVAQGEEEYSSLAVGVVVGHGVGLVAGWVVGFHDGVAAGGVVFEVVEFVGDGEVC